MSIKQPRAPNYTKQQRLKRNILAALCASSFLFLPTGPAYAMPSGSTVTNGAATITTAGNTMTIQQNSPKATIQWQDFSLDANETVHFAQKPDQIALNRVIGGKMSEINGKLKADGQIFLVNPQGVVFGKGAQVDVGGIVASTHNITDADFANANYKFKGDSKAQVLNQGSIAITADNGYAALLGAMVKNEGSIVTIHNNTKTALAAGDEMTLNLDANAFSVQVSSGAVQAIVDNKGAVDIGNGQMYMTAAAANTLYANVIHTGQVKADKIAIEGGVISLKSIDEQTSLAGAVDIKAAQEIRVGCSDQTTLPPRSDVTLSGSVTSCTPYQLIHNLDELQKINTNLSGNYMLDASIDAKATEKCNEVGTTYTGFTPLGDGTTAFTGKLDGMGFAIDRLNILDKTKDDCGLFGVNNGVITNLSLTNGTITGKNSVGAIAGQNNGSIINVFNSNKAFGENNVGGIAGQNVAGAKIEHTVNIGFANGTANIGGIAGSNIGSIQYSANHGSAGGTNEQIGGISGVNTGAITQVCNTGSIAGKAKVGGIVGSNQTASEIKDVYNTGSISGQSQVGGIIGANNSNSNLTKAYNTGLIIGTGQDIGGIVGSNAANTTINSVYNIAAILGADTTGGISGTNAGTITEAYNTGKIQAAAKAGGITGDNIGTIEKVFNTGSIRGTSEIGGISGVNTLNIIDGYNTGNISGDTGVGGISGNSAGTVQNVYNVGTVTGTTNVGELIGDNSGNMSNAYYINTPVGSGTTTGATQTTLQNLKDFTAATGPAAGFSSSIWRFEAGKTTPMLGFAVTGAATQAAIEAPIKQLDSAAAIQWGCAEDPFLAIINTTTDLTLDWQNLRLSDRDGLVSNKNLTINQYAGPSHYGTLGAAELQLSTVNGYRNRGKLNADQLRITAAGTLVLDMDQVNDSNGALKTDYSKISLQAPLIKFGYTPAAAATVVQGKVVPDYAALNKKNFSTINTSNTLSSPTTHMWVHTVYDLQNTVCNLDGAYLLAANINAGDSRNWNPAGGAAAEGFASLGNQTTPFSGALDGDNHTIDQLYIDRSGSEYIGLIGWNTGTLQNIGMHDSVISGKNYVGALTGYNAGIINNTYNDGNISGTNYIGGISGNNNSKLLNSYNTGNISGATGVGGIVGGGSAVTINGSIENVHNTGSINGRGDYIGGISGSNDNTISQAYNLGSVSGNTWTAGIVGYNRGGTVENSYNRGDITGSSICIAGIIGHDESGTIKNVYNTGTITSLQRAGGIIGHQERSIGQAFGGSLTNAYNVGTIKAPIAGGITGMYSSGKIKNVYNIGKVSGSNGEIGDIIGSGTLSAVNLKNAYYQGGINNGITNKIGTAVTAADMLKKGTFAGFDFDTAGDNWRIYEGHTMPLLRVFLKPLQIDASKATLSYNGSDQALSSALLPNTDMEHIWCATEIRNAGTYAAGDHLYWSDQQGYDITTTGEIVMQQGKLLFTADSFTVNHKDPWPSFTGTVSGFVGTDSALPTWTTPATAASPDGQYAINGDLPDPLLRNNYEFVQAPGNAIALILGSLPPVNPPVESPVEPPVEPPVNPPVEPPVNPPVNPPVEPPVNPPVEPPVNPPIEAPVGPLEMPDMRLAREYPFRYHTAKKPAEVIDIFDPSRYGRRFYNDQFYQKDQFYQCQYFF